jgi:FkbM family methyltransferase
VEFARPEKSLFQLLNKIGAAPAVVYDIGASNGFWSVTVSDGLPPAEHHLFEPLYDHPAYRYILQKNLSDHPNWKLHRIALGDRNGTATIRISSDRSAPYGSTILDIGDTPWPQRTIEQHRLDDYVANNRLPLPNAVKVDTQASELLILAGGKHAISAADILIVETWLYRSYGPQTPLLTEIIELATELGFVAHDYGNHWRDTDGTLHSIDLVFAKPAVAKALISLRNST